MANDDLRREGAEHEAEGAGRELKGKLQKNVSKLTGNEAGEAEGTVREVGGKIQKEIGKAFRKDG